MSLPDSRVRLLIIEGQTVFCKALSQVLAGYPDLQMVGMSKTIESADFATTRPTFILVDIDPDPTATDAILDVCRAQAPGVRVCILSSHAKPELMQRCLSAGADGYIVKDTSLAELVAAIKTISEGVPYADPRVSANILRRRSFDHIPDANELSARETAILRLIANGLSNRDIGGKLILSEKTVKNNVSRIFSKLGITARTQAAVHAIRTGIA
ncbi:MAG TPA: response regulator transcription factor [Candidatus Baltobacteraceae bacterium]|jgi:DNA-binding NarL/FixJ family response regulator